MRTFYKATQPIELLVVDSKEPVPVASLTQKEATNHAAELSRVFLAQHWRMRGEEERLRSKEADPEQAGHTLLELLIVVTIIGLISSLLVPRAIHYLDKAKIAQVTGNADAIMTELVLDRITRGHYAPSLDELSMPGIDLDAWHYRPARGIVDPVAPQGLRGPSLRSGSEGQAIGDGNNEDGLNPFGEDEHGYWLQAGSLRQPLARSLNKSFGWGTGGGGAFRFEPLFSPAAGTPGQGGGGGGGDSAPIPDPCASLPPGPIPVECR